MDEPKLKQKLIKNFRLKQTCLKQIDHVILKILNSVFESINMGLGHKLFLQLFQSRFKPRLFGLHGFFLRF